MGYMGASSVLRSKSVQEMASKKSVTTQLIWVIMVLAQGKENDCWKVCLEVHGPTRGEWFSDRRT